MPILRNVVTLLPGVAFMAFIALLSVMLVGLPFMAKSGISALVAAIIIGIIIGNTWQLPAQLTAGIQFSAKKILRLAIVLYGFRVTIQAIASVGFKAVLLDILIVTSTLMIGYLVGKKLFKLDQHTSLLVSVGAAICGAAAVLAVEDILKSEPYKTSVAIGTVVLFGTISMFLHPALQQAHFFGFTDTQFGIYCGASIHEVAQVIVAGSNINLKTSEIAVIVKMIRVLLLVPVLIFIAYFKSTADRRHKMIIPWFALGFACVIGFNSLKLLPNTIVADINQCDILLLTMAMGAIGMETKFAKIKSVGMKPLLLASLLFLWLFSVAQLFILKI